MAKPLPSILLMFLWPSLPLLGQEPVVDLSSYLGWAQSDSISGVDVDDQGNIFVAGWTQSINLPTANTFQTELAGGRDVFVAKLNGAERSLIWVTYIGGSSDEEASDIRVDAQGHVHVSGNTRSTDFPLEQPLQAELDGGSECFILELNSTGTALVFSTFLGGRSDDSVNSMTLTSSGETVIAGTTRSDDFPLTQGPFQGRLNGGNDAFIAKISQNGDSLLLSTYLGGEGSDTSSDVRLDEEGRILISGTTASTEFPLEKPLQEARSGSSDAFVSLLNPEGTALEFSTYLGGSSTETAHSVGFGSGGEIYLAGETSSGNFPLADPIQAAYAGGTDAFAVRIAADYSQALTSTFLGGSGYDSIRDCRINSEGLLACVGVTTSSNLPLVGAVTLKREDAELMLVVFDLKRPWLSFSSYLGGSGVEIPSGMCADHDARLLLTGVTNSIDLPQLDPVQDSVGGSGLYRSASGGHQWEKVRSDLANPNIAVLFIDPVNSWVYAGTSGAGIYRSKDRGQTWEGLGPDDQQVLSIAVDPTDSRVIYAGTASGLRRTSDEGAAWETLSDGETLPFGQFTAIAIDRANPQTVFSATASQGIFKTDNGGGLWRAKNGGLDDAGKAISSLVIDPTNANNVYMGTGAYVWRSSDGGNRWEKTSVFSTQGIRGLAIDRNNPSRLYAAVYVSAGANSGYYVARTEDGGLIWNTSANALPFPVSRLAVSPSTNSHIFAATRGGGVYRSTDSGATWAESNEGLGVRDVLDFGIDPRRGSEMYVGHESGSDGFLAALKPRNTFYFAQVADGVDGRRIKFQTAFVFVNTGSDTTVLVEFFDSNGEPLEIEVGESPPAATLEIPLAAGAASYTQTPGATSGFRVGYARVTAGPGVDGTAIFTRTDRYSRHTLYEAGVPATRAAGSFVFLLDSLEDRDTGIAMVNAADESTLNPDPAEIKLQLRDSDGFLIDETTIELHRGEHRARFIAQLFPAVAGQASEMQGLVTVESPVPLAAVTLRQRDNEFVEFPQEVASLTPFPVLPPSSLGNVLYFPQIANGVFGLYSNEEFRTSFILVNPGQIATTVTLDFFDSQGNPMGLDFGSGVPATRRQFTLAPRRFQVLETTGSGSALGYARVTSSNLSIGGTAVFKQRVATQKVTLFEAGVATTLPRRSFSIFLDSLNDWDTGLAMVNPSAEEAAEVVIRLLDLDTSQVAEEVLELLPGQHLARFIFQLFPGAAVQAREMRGVVTVQSTLPIAAITLRQKNDPDAEFPNEVPTLTTFPVISGTIQ